MLRILYYLLSFLIPPLAICSVIIYKSISDISFNDPQPLENPNAISTPENKNKLNAILLLGNKGTEITDLLISYQLLSESDKFNVYTVANHKILSPLNGGIDVLPGYTLDEIDRLLKSPPELVVIPSIPNIQASDDKPIIDWIRNKNHKDTIFLSIGEGARVLAETGLIDYRTATTHWSAIGQLSRMFPKTTWVKRIKYVQDGNTITTAGVVTGSMEGTLYVISKLAGVSKAVELSHKFRYNFTDSPQLNPFEIEISDSIWLLTALYPWNKKRMAVYVDNGISEIYLAALLDTFPRSFTADTLTYSDNREIIVTKNKLMLVPRMTKYTIGETDILIDPSRYYGSSFPFDKTISQLAEYNNKAIAKTISKTLEYPIDHLNLQGESWPYKLIIGPLALGFFGVLCAYIFDKRYLGG